MPQNEPTGHVTSAVDAEGPPRFEEADEDNAQWLEESAELPRRPRRRLLTPISIALVAALLVAVGFIAGARTEKGQTTSSSSASAGGGQAARFAALKGGQSGPGAVPGPAASGPPTGFPGAGGSAGASGTLTTGEVSYVRGGTLYVANGQGNTVKVTVSTGAKVTKTVTTKVPNINPGDTVIVRGSQGSKGSITASSISVSTSGTGSSSNGSGNSSSGGSGASPLFGSGG